MSYSFNNMGRIGDDPTDNTQINLYNTRFSNYTLSNYYQDPESNTHIQFATQQPSMMFNGLIGGSGVGNMVENENNVLYKVNNERDLEKMLLMERPFITVPYLGRGSCDPSLESQLLQGEIATDKKSVSTIMEKSFMNYSLYPNSDNVTTEDYALNGWVRGGAMTREASTT